MSFTIQTLALLCLFVGTSIRAGATGELAATFPLAPAAIRCEIAHASGEFLTTHRAGVSRARRESAVASITCRTADAIDFQIPEDSSARSLTVRPNAKINAAAIDL